MLCFLIKDEKDGLFICAVTSFACDADRQLANKQREAAHDKGMWVSAESMKETWGTLGSLSADFPAVITNFPYKIISKKFAIPNYGIVDRSNGVWHFLARLQQNGYDIVLEDLPVNQEAVATFQSGAGITVETIFRIQ